ncbi:hypothetical protein [Actinomadura madurae]|uniref:hypothetical protein n=1 Tax=Actinomadura madurae TaxID=1993 RepID=UPI000D9EC89F|nr:hypothetical protein [Actinomadura madurae]SPT60167.1 Uncharacterised protein [Actinomadura madurae]
MAEKVDDEETREPKAGDTRFGPSGMPEVYDGRRWVSLPPDLPADLDTPNRNDDDDR